MRVSSEFCQYATELPIKYSQFPKREKPKASSNDCLALALAKQAQVTFYRRSRLKNSCKSRNYSLQRNCWVALQDGITYPLNSTQFSGIRHLFHLLQ